MTIDAIDYGALETIPCPLCDCADFWPLLLRTDSARIVRCVRCGHAYLNPAFSEKMLEVLYRDYLSEGEQTDAETQETLETWFLDPAGPYQFALREVEKMGGLSGQKILEVGCGHGRFLAECRKRGGQVTGVDVSAHAVRCARAYYGLELIQARAEKFLEQDGKVSGRYDWIFAFELIEHVRDPRRLLRALFGAVKPGGQLVLSTPNFHLYALMGKAAPSASEHMEHIQFFDPEVMERCLQECGFDSVKVSTTQVMHYGERQKRRLSQTKPLWELWCTLKKIPGVPGIKEAAFKALGRYREPADEKQWNGTSLVCVARKPEPQAE